MKAFFITGTDTNCGKTYAVCQMLDHLKNMNKKALAIKPVASGFVYKNGEYLNEDIQQLEKHNYMPFPINAWQFISPISPHLAAKEVGEHLQSQEILKFCQKDCYQELDYLLIEGAGGLMVPLNQKETWVDFLQLSQFPVILIVGMRLGCLNHALLTAFVLRAKRINCMGWIANCLDHEMLVLAENIETLKQKIEMPLLGTIAYQDKLQLRLSFLD